MDELTHHWTISGILPHPLPSGSLLPECLREEEKEEEEEEERFVKEKVGLSCVYILELEGNTCTVTYAEQH